ncbi:MAG: peptidoglycan bridge formation glycyltransferase FemA/FemB family protein [Spirochaetaceae bacterium]|nr:peptidoglycan bridge formation glycyltransferase FemA/FemB family protein [Spirochaetaceae bacterium]
MDREKELVRQSAPVNVIRCESMTVASAAENFLQSDFWGRFKERFGWKAIPVTVEWPLFGGAPQITALLVLYRKLAPAISIAYVPWGPQLPCGNFCSNAERGAALGKLARQLKVCLPRDTVFIRFDPPWEAAHDDKDQCITGMKPAAAIQAPDTVIVNLRENEETLLAGMKPKTRYNIRLAERNVTVTRPGAAALDVFYALLQETAVRDGIALHGSAYYRALFEEAENAAQREPFSQDKTNQQRAAQTAVVHLYLAEHEGDVIAGIITLWYKNTATYLYGASASRKRNLMAPYALQWQAMRDAKAAGCLSYDLFGIPPNADPNHPMAGLYRFKTGFGGAIVHRAASQDYPCKLFLYRLFRTAETARKLLRDRKKRTTRKQRGE